MTYSVAWDETVPAGNTAAAQIDDRIRDRQTAIRERICDIFGGLTVEEFAADPIVGIKGIRGSGSTDFTILGGTSTTSVKDSSGDNDDLVVDHSTGDVTVRRDIIAAGGFKTLIDGWSVADIAASVSATEMTRSLGRALMPSPGSIISIGVSLAAGQACAGGTLSVEVWKASINKETGARTESATGLTAVISTSTNEKCVMTSEQDLRLDTFDAGDEIFVKYTTDSSWSPTTADCQVVVGVAL